MRALLLILIVSFLGARECRVPLSLAPSIGPLNFSRIERNLDIIRNLKKDKNLLKKLCFYSIYFKEHNIPWSMVLVFNKNHPKGPFWFLPHDNENSAFDSAIYATLKYGGGFLAVETGGKRNNHKIDPNRNFSLKKTKRCKTSPIFTKTVFKVIEHFKPKSMPYLSLHSNSDGFRGDGRGGRGTISILKKSKSTKSFPAYEKILQTKRGGLADEDSLVYIAGRASNPPKSKLDSLLRAGLNVKYEIVSPKTNDCSMSNFIVLNKKSTNYYNIEVEHSDTKTQKKMIDKLLKVINN